MRLIYSRLSRRKFSSPTLQTAAFTINKRAPLFLGVLITSYACIPPLEEKAAVGFGTLPFFETCRRESCCASASSDVWVNKRCLLEPFVEIEMLDLPPPWSLPKKYPELHRTEV